MQSYRRFRLRTGARGYERMSGWITLHYTLLNQVSPIAL